MRAQGGGAAGTAGGKLFDLDRAVEGIGELAANRAYLAQNDGDRIVDAERMETRG